MKKSALPRDRDYPVSNRVRYIRWRMKQFEKKLHPDKEFPIEIYRQGD